MRRKLWKKPVMACLALLIVSGGVPVQPFLQMPSITANAAADYVAIGNQSFTSIKFANNTPPDEFTHDCDVVIDKAGKEPNCTQSGFTEGTKCSLCDKTIMLQKEMPAKGHSWNESTYSWTAIDGGYECTATRTCSNGEHHESETVNAAYKVITELTASAKVTGRYTATFTNESFSEQNKDVEIDMTDSEYADVVYKWTEDYISVTAPRKYTNVGDNIIETVSTTSEITNDATCEENSQATYYSEPTNELFTKQEKNVENLDVYEHTFDGNGKCTLCNGVPVNEKNFSDEKFREYVKNECDKDDNNVLSEEEIKNITTINVSEKGIENLDGIEFFTDLKILQCAYNSITELDLRKNLALKELYCFNNPSLTSIKFAKNKPPATFWHDCHEVAVAEIPATCTKSGRTEGTKCSLCNKTITGRKVIPVTDHELDENGKCTVCGGVSINDKTFPDNNFREYVKTNFDKDVNGIIPANEIKFTFTIDARKLSIENFKGIEFFTALKTLYCPGIKITKLDLSKNPALTHLECYNSAQLAEIDLSNNPALKEIYCCGNPSLTSIKFADNTLLQVFDHDCHKVTVAGTSATCTTSGLTEGTKCSLCDKIITKQEVIPATGHSHGNPIWSWANINGNYTATMKKVCSKCDEIETIEADVTSSTADDVIFYTATATIGDKKYTSIQQVNESYTFSVEGGTIARGKQDSYSYGDAVTVKADKTRNNRYFSGWYIGDTCITTKQRYTFFVKSNMTVTAKYEGDTVQKEKADVSVMISRTNIAGSKQKVVFSLNWALPTGCKLKEAGIIRRYGSAANLKIELVDGSAIRKNASTLRCSNGNCNFNLKVSATTKQKSINAVAYVTYIDKNGNIRTDYTTVKTSNYTA